MDWNERMIRNQVHAMDRDMRIGSTLRAWWEDVLYTQRWIEQPRPRWDPAYCKPRVRWMINTTTLAVTYDVVARICGFSFLVAVWFRFVQQSNKEDCQDCCIAWSTTISDMSNNLSSFTCLFGGGLNWWIGVFGMDNFSQYPIFAAIPELVGKFVALWLLSKFSAGRKIFNGEFEFGLVHFLLLSVIGGFILLVAWRIIYVGLTRSLNRIGEWIGVGSPGFQDSPDQVTDPYLELGSACMRMIGMLSIAREVLLFDLNTFCQPSFSLARFIFSFKRLFVRFVMYMFCAWILPEKIALIKVDIQIHSQKWLESPRPRWIPTPPKVRWIVETERLAVIYDTTARTVASGFALILWLFLDRSEQWVSNDSALTFTLVFGGAVAWYHISLCCNLDDVVFKSQDIVELLVQFLAVFWLVREQAHDELGDVGVHYISKCLIFSIGGGLLVFISWRKVYRNLMDGLIYNLGEWIGLRNSTFREDAVWCTDCYSQIVDSVGRLVVQPAMAREILLFAFRSCKLSPDEGIFGGSFATTIKDLIVHIFLIKLAHWLFLLVFDAVVKFGLLQPFIHPDSAAVLHHSQEEALAAMYYMAKDLSNADHQDSGSEVPRRDGPQPLSPRAAAGEVDDSPRHVS